MSTAKPVLGSQIQFGHYSAQGLVACWLMNEGSGSIIMDLSGDGNNGVLGGSTQFVSGESGNCLGFDGNNDFVSLGKPLVNGELTVSYWEWAKGDGAYNGNDGYHISDSDDPTNFYMRRYASGTNQITGGIAGGSFSASAIGTVLVEQWNHITVTCGNGVASVYVNSILRQAIVRTFAAFNSGVYLGNNPALTRDFDGKLDNILIYNRCLSPQEVTNLYIHPYCIFEEIM
jgi:hypothetical protein